MSRRNTKWAKMVMDAWLSGIDAPTVSDADRSCIQNAIAGLKPLVVQQDDRSMVAAFEMCNLILANLVSRHADVEALKNLTKENLDMAIKASDRALKTNASVVPTARPAAKMHTGGIASQLRPLIKRTKGALERCIVDLDQQGPQTAGAPPTS